MDVDFENINYHPQIKYTLERLPNNEFVEDIINEQEYLGAEDLKNKLKDVITKIDFLIYKCEETLTNTEGNDVNFEDYKPLAYKKYYCQSNLTNAENNTVKNYEDGMDTIEKRSVESNLYPKLLQLKEDNEDDLSSANNIKDVENQEFKSVLGEAASYASSNNNNPPSHNASSNNNDEYEQFGRSLDEGLKNIEGNVKDYYDKAEEFTEKKIDNDRDDNLESVAGSVDSSGNDINNNFNEIDNFNKPPKEEQDPEYLERLAAVNKKIRQMKNAKQQYLQEYRKLIKQGRPERALAAKASAEQMDVLINNKIDNKLGMTASHSFALYTKASKTEDFLEKSWTLTQSSVYDTLNGNLCCLIKAILKTVELSHDGEETNAFDYMTNRVQEAEDQIEEEKTININNSKISFGELKRVIDKIRGLLAMSYGKNKQRYDELRSKINNLILSPIKSIVNAAINLLKKVENEIIDQIKDWLGVLLESNSSRVSENNSLGENLLECYTLESLADFIFDEIEDKFDDMEDYITDLYKLVYNYIHKMNQDVALLGEKKWIKDTYNILTKLSEQLDTIDEFDLSDGIEEWVNQFLADNGFGYTYNPQTGEFDSVGINGCIDPVEDNGRNKSGSPNSSEEINNTSFEDSKEFNDFLKHQGEVNITCDFNNEKEEEVKNNEDMSAEEIENKAMEEAQNIINQLGG